MTLAANTRLGPYEVMGPLSAGGMGEVYRARDAQLGRTVALKVLRTELFGDASAVARFQREAKMASSLNHPHIISIYSIHEGDGFLGIAMELVDGETLSDWQASQKPSLGRLLDVFIQIADALDAAHGAGIVHRDIKPSNILVNGQGYAKVLDFGLAKQVLPVSSEDSQLSTATNITGASEILGTPAYMSPEQASGKVVDARTDIFSLGVMLYEATTGVRPFVGDSAIPLLHAVITLPARPVLEVKPTLPAELQWILERALAKDPKDRYASMGEFAAELRRLRSKADSTTATIQRPMIGHPVGRWLAAGLLVSLAVAGIWLYRSGLQGARPTAVRYEQLTDFNDAVFAPTLSPDGRMVAFIRGGNFGSSAARGELYVKLLPNGDPIQLTHDGLGKHTPTFTPDGNRIVYTRVDKSFVWDSWQVPVLGGAPSPFMPNASGLTFLSEQEIMFAEINRSPHMGIMTSRLNRVGQREIYMPPGEGDMAHRAALSPDRQWVLVVEMDGSGWLPCRVVPFDGSSPGRRVGPQTGQCTTAAWSPDGGWMYFSSNAGGAFHLWRQPFPDGQPEQITSDSNQQEGTAITADGKSLITSAGTNQGTIWLRDAKGDRQLTFQGTALLPRMGVDGQKVFYLQSSGRTRSYVSGELWMVDLATDRKESVLPGIVMSHYDVSPDGRQLLFAATEGDKETGIWVADLDRRTPPRQLTTGGEYRAFFAGIDEIVFMSNGNERFLYKMGKDGSARTRVNDGAVTFLIGVSPDGAWAAAVTPQATGKDGNQVMLIPTRNPSAPPLLICNSCVAGFGPARQDAPLISWTSDGRSVLLSLKYFGLQSRKTVLLPFNPANARAFQGARTDVEFARLPGARMLDESNVFPARGAGEYLISRRASSTNLFRVILPE